MLRTLNRTNEVGIQRQTLTINAANPAVDRAKAKLAYLFNPPQDAPFSFPSGTPGEGWLEERLAESVFDLPDEQRIDINGDNTPDNAWVFRSPNNSNQIIAYSILVRRPTDDQINDSDSNKAQNLLTRNRPALFDTTNPCLESRGEAAREGAAGWDDFTSEYRKNFQVNAVVYEVL
ncbi:hypothetical protein [Thermosynechococcus sp. FA-CM-4201]